MQANSLAQILAFKIETESINKFNCDFRVQYCKL